jgi:solute carrier family 35 (adenosine 3'-phospho 5'-phosphosulfate transporter), member B3
LFILFYSLAILTCKLKKGVILVCGSLCSDAVIGNLQEKKMKLHQASNYEVVLYSYGIGFIYILIGQLLFDKPFEAFSFWLEVSLIGN